MLAQREVWRLGYGASLEGGRTNTRALYRFRLKRSKSKGSWKKQKMDALLSIIWHPDLSRGGLSREVGVACGDLHSGDGGRV